MKKNSAWNKWNDMLLAVFLILTLFFILYLMPAGSLNIWTGAFILCIIIPTLRALIKGAPFVPTPMLRVQKMLKLANIKKDEKVFDIGCGDGRMVYLAAKEYGAKATGLELSPLVYFLAKIRQLLWRSKAKILFRDFHSYSLQDADVVVCYLLPETLINLQSKLEKELKKGARVVSYAFKVGDWQESHREERDTVNNMAPIWVYER